MNYLGIDVGKFSHSACLLDETGRKKIFQIPSNKQGFEKFGKLVKSIKVDELLVGMEATGHYFLNIYDFLLGLGLLSENVAVLNPLQVKAFRNTNLRGAKSDDIDATRIAVLLRFGDFQRCNVAIDKLMNLRELTRLRSGLVANNGDIKRKIISVLDRIFPEFPTVFSNCFGKTAMHLITEYPTPEDLGSLSLTKLEKTIKGLSKRGISKSKIEKLHHLATNSVGIKLGVEAFKIELQILIARLKMCKEQITDLEQKISKIVNKFPGCKYIFSIPGVGQSTGATILAEIGDIGNFKSSIKLIAFAGLDPKLKQSGKYQGKTPISKRGSKYLRSAIWQSAMVAARVDPMFKKIYQDKRDKGKSHKYAVTATANKMTKVIYSVLKNNRPFKEQIP
ncbi:IS110 family transposase [Patescibacteria group bacterium]|nr:IS110 family transposase [Patescibacteria group bacterium]